VVSLRPWVAVNMVLALGLEEALIITWEVALSAALLALWQVD
jgi:hypothetical protein